MWIKTSLDYGNFEYDSNTNVYFIKQNCFIKAPKNLILNNEKNKTINYNKISLISNQPKFLIKYTTGYYHTLMDFFGYIINAVEISKKLNIKPLFIFAGAPSTGDFFENFFYKWLKDLNIEDYVILKYSDKLLEANNCFYLSECKDSPIPNPINSLYKTFENFYVINKNIEPFRKLYLSRRKVYRNVEEENTYKNNIKVDINSEKSRYPTMIRLFEEEKLENFLIDYGFEIIHPENKFENNFLSQINYFYETKTIMSLTSGGLINQIFMQPNTNIIEISTSHFFPKRLTKNSVPISEFKPVDNINYAGEEHLQNFYKSFSHVKDQFYCAITNEDLQADTVINKIKNNKYLMDIIND